MPDCTLKDWYSNNLQSFTWYKETYPFLNSFDLPIGFAELQKFYLDDMDTRNLEPLDEFTSCYENLFSYFLENYPRQDDATRFMGKTWLERTVENFPGAVSKTAKDIGSTVSDVISPFEWIASNLWWIVIGVIIILILITINK